MLDLRVALYRQLHAMPFAFFARQQPGEAVSHVLNDVQGVGGAVSGTLADVAQNAVVLVIDDRLRVRARLASRARRARISSAVHRARRAASARRASESSDTAQARVGELTGILTETLSVSGALLIKVFGGGQTRSSAGSRRRRTKSSSYRSSSRSSAAGSSCSSDCSRRSDRLSCSRSEGASSSRDTSRSEQSSRS